MSTRPVFRVTQYEVTWTASTSASLNLKHKLATHHFILLEPVSDTAGPASSMWKVDMPTASKEVFFSRGSATGTGTMTVTVVECLTAHDTDGFRLLDQVSKSLTDPGTGVDAQTATSATPWTDIGQVVLFGGWRGAGISTTDSSSASVWARIYPSSTATVNFERHAVDAADVDAATCNVYVLQFGTNWTIQRSTITANNFGAETSAANWNNATITSVVRANTMLFSTGYADVDTTVPSTMLALGDGVTELDNETKVALNWRATSGTARSFEVYTMEHASLAVDWRSKHFGDGAVDAYTYTVDAPVSDERGYSTTTTGGRLVFQTQNEDTATPNENNGLWRTRQTRPSTVAAARTRVSAMDWAARLQSVDFGNVTQSVTVAKNEVFRVTTYEIESPHFDGITYDLLLDNPLARNYFAFVKTTSDLYPGGGDISPEVSLAAITADPFGTGDYAVSTAANVLGLTRGGTSGSGDNLIGSVTVIECLKDFDRSGFRLRTCMLATVPAETVTGLHQFSQEAVAPWTDTSQVVPFGGQGGAGVHCATGTGTEWDSAYARIYLAGDRVVNIDRYGPAADAATFSVQIVEFGSSWTVQHNVVSGGNFGNGTAVGHWNTSTLATAVTRANSFVWAAGWSEETTTVSGLALSVDKTLGDGVTQLATETLVATGNGLDPTNTKTDVYTISNPRLAVDHVRHALGDAALLTYDYTVDAAGGTESYNTGTAVSHTFGSRAGLLYNSGDADVTSGVETFWYPRHTATGTLNAQRPAAGLDGSAPWQGWAQSIDFNNVNPVRGTAPAAYMIFPDRNWQGSGNVASITSEGGRTIGNATPAAANLGSVIPFQEGTPLADVDIDYRSQVAGIVDSNGTFLWKQSTDSATNWKGQNHEQFWHRNWANVAPFDTGIIYGTTCAFSSKNNRVIFVNIDTSAPNTTINFIYRDVDDPWATTYSSASVATFDNILSANSEGGVDMIELDSGLMMLVHLTNPKPTSTTFIGKDINVYLSPTGIGNWTKVGSEILKTSTVSGVAMNSSNGLIRMDNSGDWVRIIAVNDQTSGTPGTGSLRTLASSDSGHSWKQQTDLTDMYSWGGAASVNQTACAIVGLDDISGTFLLIRTKFDDVDQLEVFTASRFDDWTLQTSLQQDLSGTAVELKGISIVRLPHEIHVYIYAEGTNVGDVYCIVIDRSAPLSAASWGSVQRVTGYRQASMYIPMQWKSAWAGNHVVHWGGLMLPTDNTGDPGRTGNFLVHSGGWDSTPLAPSWREISYGENDFDVVQDLSWFSYMGTPAGDSNSDPSTGWTRTVSGTPTVTWTSNSTKVAASGTDFGYYEHSETPAVLREWGLNAGAADERYGNVIGFTAQLNSSRTTDSDDCGVRVISAGNNCDFSIRLGDGTFVVYDNAAGTTRTTVSGLPTSARRDFRATIVGPDLVVLYREATADPLITAWSNTGNLTLGALSTTVNDLRFGVLASPGAGSADVEFNEVWVSYLTNMGQVDMASSSTITALTNPDDMGGAFMRSRNLLIRDGVYARWAGSGTLIGDTFTGQIEHTRGAVNFSLDSPQLFWESTSTVAQNIVLLADPDESNSIWQMDALALVDTVDETATIEFNDSDSWATPATSFPLDSRLFDDLMVIDVEGSAVRLSSATNNLPQRGESTQKYIRFLSANLAYAIRTDQNVEDGWVHVDADIDLATVVTMGEAVVVYTDRMVWRGTGVEHYKYSRIVLPSQGLPGSTHRIGAVVPGIAQDFDVPLDWTWRNNEQPNITKLKSRGAVSWEYKEGPAARVIEGRVIGDASRFREQIRDMLREYQNYSERPMALVVNDKNAAQTMIYGRWESGSQYDNQAWYVDPQGVWRTAGDVSIAFSEEP